jgi:hypothetical protein
MLSVFLYAPHLAHASRTPEPENIELPHELVPS